MDFAELVGNMSVKDRVQHCKSTDLSLWKQAYPRRVMSPPSYVNHQMVGVHLFHSMIGRKKGDTGSVAPMVILVLERLNLPSYYITADLCRALLETDPPESLSMAELQWPVDGMVLMIPDLPEVREIFGGIPQFIAIARYRGNTAMGLNTDAVAFTSALILDGRHTTCDSFHPAFLPLREIKKSMESDLNDKTGHRVVSKLMSLAVLSIMAMSARSDLVEEGALARKAKMTSKHPRDHEELWNPTWIGKTYRIASQGDGTHAKPRTHLRRGHMRMQVHGSDRSLRKMIWIEPVWVNLTVSPQ